MKREIKFRGKRTDNREWVEGSFMPDYIQHKSGASIVQGGVVWHEVDPETVGQYTELKDKNGKEIYEGDILKFKANYSLSPCGWMKAKVVITEYRLELHSENGFVYDAQEETDEFPYAHCEVIGNIHDNHEEL